MQRKLRVYVETPFANVRPKNTDWLYMRDLNQLPRYVDLDITLSREYRLAAEEACVWGLAKLKRTFGLQNKHAPISRILRESAVRVDNPDVIYSHGRMPIIERLPVVWFYGVVDPKMRMRMGEAQQKIEEEYQILEPMFRRAELIVSPCETTAQRHRLQFPKISDKFVACPFFLPHISSESIEAIVAKHEDDERINVLFVGREVIRKGLDLLMATFSSLSPNIVRKIVFHIVAPHELVPKYVSQLACKVRLHGELAKDAVMTLMRQAHVFAMPSRFESYGLVYLEAMASGAVVVAPDFEAQREICDEGQCGILVEPEAEDVTAAIVRLMDRTHRIDLAKAALKRFNECYAPEEVAVQHREMFTRAANKLTS